MSPNKGEIDILFFFFYSNPGKARNDLCCTLLNFAQPKACYETAFVLFETLFELLSINLIKIFTCKKFEKCINFFYAGAAHDTINILRRIMCAALNLTELANVIFQSKLINSKILVVC